MPRTLPGCPDGLDVRRVLGSPQDQAVRFSMPVPRGGASHYRIGDAVAQSHPLAWWPEGGRPGAPRRILLLGTPKEAADRLTVCHGPPPAGDFAGPAASLDVVERLYESRLAYEINELVLRLGDRWLGIRVGLLTDEGIHWWQWCRLETLHEGPVCCLHRVMGAIPVHFETEKDIPAQDGSRLYPYLHKHDHVRGEVVARCFSNGVIELLLRHVNGFFFTEGGDLDGAVPVFGFRSAEGSAWPDAGPVTGPCRWQVGSALLDTSGSGRLISEEHPGRLWTERGVLIYQPYEGIEILAGSYCEARTGDAYLCRALQRRIPKGVARTVRIAASLGEAPPEVAVYTAPAWWYGFCEELAPAALLPVRDETDEGIRDAESWLNTNLHEGSFDDGAQCRGPLLVDGKKSGEPGWEGEAPYAQLLAAYRSGDPNTYDLAIRSSYHVADVATDHAFFAVRMHSYRGGHSLPMQRVLAHYGTYLETGDPYLAETAMAVAEHAYWWDRTYYPRRSIGRDAAYIRGLIFLYRYTGETLYARRAREAIGRTIAVQWPDGSYADQGGTKGIHGVLNLIVKPWMGCIATEPMVDYLGIEPEDTEVAHAVLRFADWLLTHRVEENGRRLWSYQWGYDGLPTYSPLEGPPWPLPTPGGWHVEYLAKILGWASLHTGRPEYYQAWRDSYEAVGQHLHWDHGAGKAIQNLGWLSARLWNARLVEDAIEMHPRPDLTLRPMRAFIGSPHGDIEVSAETPGLQRIRAAR